MRPQNHIKLVDLLFEVEGDSNPLGMKYVDIWHNGQDLAKAGNTKAAIRMMNKAAILANKEKSKGEAGYYLGTIAWLNKDYQTVENYTKDSEVINTGNDQVLKRLLANKGKSYNEAY